jgi:hypothetical protein
VPNALTLNLVQNIDRLKLDALKAQILPLHEARVVAG